MRFCVSVHHRVVWSIRILLVAVLSPMVVPAWATQVVEWRNVPISIVLNVGEERVLAFPDHVQVGLPPTLTAAKFRTQSTGGTVLWLAHEPFESHRLQVRLVETGHVMLFDVTAIATEGAEPADAIQVVFPETVRGGTEFGPDDGLSLTPVKLTRFVAQQLYAPARLLQAIPGLRRVPMGTPESVMLYRGDQVSAKPLASWQGGGIYVTAVMLTNLGTKRVLLDPRDLRGRFVAATFQHNSLGPTGSRSDVTSVYLVTDDPFINVLDVDMSNIVSAHVED